MEVNKLKETTKINAIQESEHKYIYCILNKILHKPIIIGNIYSFSQNRPYILLHLISNDTLLKSSLKNTFDNARKDNKLSKEINMNINNYILFRKINELLEENCRKIKSNIFEYNEKLNLIIGNSFNKKEKSKNEILNDIIDYYKNISIEKDFIDKNHYIMEETFIDLYYSSYKKEKEANNMHQLKKYHINSYNDIYQNFNQIDSVFFNTIIERELKRQKNKNIIIPEKTRELLKQISYYEYISKDLIIKYFENLNKKEKEIFLDIIYYFYNIHNSYLIKILKSHFNICHIVLKNIENFVEKN